MRSLRMVEIHVTVNNIQILSVAQTVYLWRIYMAGNNQTHLNLQEKCPIFLSDFNQIWNFS
jgi:hypothetical protein